ncbi:DNA-binding response regulator [Sphingomonas sp. DBB INV C78]
MRRGVCRMIEERPDWHIVGEAASGQEAIKLARETTPDIAVLDYSLPLMNGIELGRRLKRELPHIEILIYTMHDREDTIAEAMHAGIRGYVLKHEPAQHLLAAIHALSARKPYFSSVVSQSLLERVLRHDQAMSPSHLTPREREVVQLIAEGRINKDIAGLLGISAKTVETHRSMAMSKLELRSTAELVRYAMRHNLVEP